jgi:hypothetical protein
MSSGAHRFRQGGQTKAAHTVQQKLPPGGFKSTNDASRNGRNPGRFHPFQGEQVFLHCRGLVRAKGISTAVQMKTAGQFMGDPVMHVALTD